MCVIEFYVYENSSMNSGLINWNFNYNFVAKLLINLDRKHLRIMYETQEVIYFHANIGFHDTANGLAASLCVRRNTTTWNIAWKYFVLWRLHYFILIIVDVIIVSMVHKELRNYLTSALSLLHFHFLSEHKLEIRSWNEVSLLAIAVCRLFALSPIFIRRTILLCNTVFQKACGFGSLEPF